jgi:ABC-2 type transport system ATP-binding protein
MARPKVLLLDEPSVGVDPVSRQDLWRMVQALTDEGMAVIWSTAYLDEAERCESVLLLNEGTAPVRRPAAGADRAHRRQRSFRLDRTSVPSAAACPDARHSNLGSVERRRDPGRRRARGVARWCRTRSSSRPCPLRRRCGSSPCQRASKTPSSICSVAAPAARPTLAERIAPVEAGIRTLRVVPKALTKRFGEFTATDNVSFEVRNGAKSSACSGPNGAGKSTTFKMLCGLLKPTAGEAHVVGHDLRRATGAAKSRLGYMAQKFSLYGLLSVQQNLEFSAGVYGLEGNDPARAHRRDDRDLRSHATGSPPRPIRAAAGPQAAPGIGLFADAPPARAVSG